MITKPDSFSSKAINFFLELKNIPSLPSDVSLLNPYKNPETASAVKQFYSRFYNDLNNRIFIFGINPGRFGGGITGIPFTDPVALQEFCGIENQFIKRRELSSFFIYSLISEMSGVNNFFSAFYLTAIFPLTLIRNGNNFNYYDNPGVLKSLKKFIPPMVSTQINFGAERSAAVSLGKRNAVYLNELNSEYKFFNRIIVLEHPRFIVQYRRKYMPEYLSRYKEELSALLKETKL